MTVTKMIYGTAWKKERTTSLVVSAVLNGFRAIDTACQLKHYREDLVGEALAILQDKHGIQRKDIFLQTKFTPISGQDIRQPLPYLPTSPVPAQIESSLEQSLSNLRTDYLDSYILHSPLDSLPATLSAWRTLIAQQDQGKVKKIGVSNTYDVGILESLERDGGRAVQIVQNRWYEGNNWDRDVVRYCVERGIQYQSFWTLSGSPSLLGHPSLIALSRRKQLTLAQSVYLFARSLGITPLSGTTNVEHMKEDLEPEKMVAGDEPEFADLKKFIWG